MKRHRHSHSRRPCDLAGGSCGEVSLAGGSFPACIEEHRLDEQQIRAAQEGCESLTIAKAVGDIRDMNGTRISGGTGIAAV